MDYIAESLQNDINIWSSIVKEMEEELSALPSDNLYVKTVNGKQYLYHHKTEFIGGQRRRVYTTVKGNINIALSNFFRRKFLKQSLTAIKFNLRLINKTLGSLMPYSPQAAYSSLDIRKFEDFANSKVLEGIVHSPSLFTERTLATVYGGNAGSVSEWLSKDNFDADFHPQTLFHITSNGTKVRSKSEVLIADLLENQGIAYKYEAPIEFDGITLHPDFTIIRPSDMKIMYWEHFGMMGDENYVSIMLAKLAKYIKNGITPGAQLITTYDTPEGFIDVRSIKNAISFQLLQK